MAKNRVLVKTVEPEPQSEEDSSSGEETGSQEIKQSQSTLKKNQRPAPSSSLSSSSGEDENVDEDEDEEGQEEEEDESDSGSDAEVQVMPIAKKILDDATKSTCKRPSEANVLEDAAKTVKKPKKHSVAAVDVASKKQLENDSCLASAVAKTKQLENESGSAAAALDCSSSKRAPFQRLFSEEDEIEILNGMLDYAAKKQVSPTADPNAFYEFINEKLKIVSNGIQVLRKMKRLKKKYMNIKLKGRNLSKPHEIKAFELSEKIWGKEIAVNGNGSGSAKAATQKSRAKMNANGNGNIKTALSLPEKIDQCVSIDEKVLTIGAYLFEGEEQKEDEDSKKWRKLLLDEMEIRIDELVVQRARATLVLDALKAKKQ